MRVGVVVFLFAVFSASVLRPPGGGVRAALVGCRRYSDMQNLLRHIFVEHEPQILRFIRDWMAGRFVGGSQVPYLGERTGEPVHFVLPEFSLFVAIQALGRLSSSRARGLLFEIITTRPPSLLPSGVSPRKRLVLTLRLETQFWGCLALARARWLCEHPRFVERLLRLTLENPSVLADQKCWDGIVEAAWRCGLLRRVLIGAMKRPAGHENLLHSASALRAVWREIPADVLDRFLRQNGVNLHVRAGVAAAALTCGLKELAERALAWLAQHKNHVLDGLALQLAHQVGIVPPSGAAHIVRLACRRAGFGFAACLAREFCEYYIAILHHPEPFLYGRLCALFCSLSDCNLHFYAVASLTGEEPHLPDPPPDLPHRIQELFLPVVTPLAARNKSIKKCVQALRSLCRKRLRRRGD